MDKYGIKELYDVSIKANVSLTFADRTFEEGETIISFDSIQIASVIQEQTSVTASGGYKNPSLIYWDNTKDVRFNCNEGVFSRRSVAFVGNSKMFKIKDPVSIPINGEIIEPENGLGVLKHCPNGKGFIYDKETGKKLYSNLDKKEYELLREAIADYYYDYCGGLSQIEIGNNAFTSFLRLEGKMRLKDDSDGHDKTAIIILPKIKIASSLNIRLGRNVNPSVGVFSFIAYPTGVRGSQKVMDIQILNDDIDSDF